MGDVEREQIHLTYADDLRAERDRLRAALERFGEHHGRCESVAPVPGARCTCGLRAALSDQACASTSNETLREALERAYRQLSNCSHEHDERHNLKWANEARGTLRAAITSNPEAGMTAPQGLTKGCGGR